MGKSIISMVILNSYVSHYQRVRVKTCQQKWQIGSLIRMGIWLATSMLSCRNGWYGSVWNLRENHQCCRLQHHFPTKMTILGVYSMIRHKYHIKLVGDIPYSVPFSSHTPIFVGWTLGWPPIGDIHINPFIIGQINIPKNWSSLSLFLNTMWIHGWICSLNHQP